MIFTAHRDILLIFREYIHT